ncbi:hypothetical protein D3C76_1824510 [compost metagenome]
MIKASDEAMSTRELRELILEQEGANQLVQEENQEERKKAERVLSSVQKVLDSGGETAKWIQDELKRILKEVEM